MMEETKKKKKKNIWKILMNIISIICILSLLFCLYSIFRVSGIENEIRYIGMGLLILINILLLVIFRKITKKKKISRYLIFIIVIAILTFGQSYVGYFIYKTYASIDNINKSSITYSTDIIVYKDSKILSTDALKNKKIGIVVDKNSIDSYLIGKEIIDSLKLNDLATIIEYDNISNLVSDLYDSKIDAAIVSSNYASMLNSLEKFKNIKDDVKSIYNKKKTYKKDEIAKITGEEKISLNTSGSITEPFTILVMGIDSTVETLAQNATGNGDALMLVTFNPKTLNATILSIPRDTYTSISCLGGIENKITHAAWGGESCMISSVQNLTGINIDYYVKINFKGVVKLVNSLGGITVDVPKSLDGVCEQNSNRSSRKHNIQCFKAGVQKLNGEQALAMARHRKTLTTGDFERGLNQQKVVQGVLNQLKTVRSANQALKILDSISNSMDTNFTTKQLLSFYEIFKNILDTSSSENLINMQQLYISGSGQMIYDERAGMTLYNFIPSKCSLDEDIKAMKNNLKTSTSTASWKKEMDFDIEETFKMTIIGQNTYCGTNTYTLLTSVVGKNVDDAKRILQSFGLTVVVKEEIITDGSYANGIVISQSYPANKRIDKISDKTITIKVAKVEEKVDEPLTDPDTEPDDNTDTDTDEPDNDTPPDTGNENEGDTTPPDNPPATTGCSDPAHTSKDTCEAAGGTWTE